LSAVVYSATPAVERSRLTVFFRYFTVLPHFITLAVYGIGAYFAVIFAWFGLMFTGRYPEGLYAYVSKVLRYAARVTAYSNLLVDTYPPFDLDEHPEYPVQLQIGPPQESYSRLKVFFRGLLFIPVYIVGLALAVVGGFITAILWFIAVITGRSPEGLSGTLKMCLSYQARAGAFATMLTEDWPSISDEDAPAAPIPAAAPAPPSAAPDTGVTPPPPPPPPAGGNPFGE
jgi:magnesium-transporting ATPase (P-type)